MLLSIPLFSFRSLFSDATAPTQIYTLSLHDALPISTVAIERDLVAGLLRHDRARFVQEAEVRRILDRKSTRLNSSHLVISYAVFCLKKKRSSIVHLVHLSPRVTIPPQ